MKEHLQLQPPAPSEHGSTELIGFFLTGSQEFDHNVEDMVIYDRASWNVYINKTLRDVTDRLEKQGCSNGFATICYLLEYERQGMIKKETVVSLFSEVLGL